MLRAVLWRRIADVLLHRLCPCSAPPLLVRDVVRPAVRDISAEPPRLVLAVFSALGPYTATHTTVVFTARTMLARYMLSSCVFVSVCLSQVGVLQRRLNLG